MRVLYIALGLCVCLLASVIVFLPNFVDWNDYRVQLADSIEQSMGRDVTIAGGLHLELVPRPIIRIEDLKIKNRLDAKHEDFLRIKNIEADLSIKDLIFGNLVMQNIILKRPAIYFDVLPNGTKAWDVQSETKATQKISMLEGLSQNIAFDDIQIEDGTISFYNGVSDKSYIFEKSNFSLNTDSQSGPFSITGNGLYQGEDLDFKMTSSGIKKEGTAFNASVTRADKALDLVLNGMYRNNVQGVFVDGDLDIAMDSVQSFVAVDAPLKAKAKLRFIHKKNDLSSMDRFRLNTQEINGTLGASKIKGQVVLDYNGAQSNSKHLFNHDYTIQFDRVAFDANKKIVTLIDLIPQGFGKGFVKIDELSMSDNQLFNNVTMDYGRQVIDNDQSLITVKDARALLPDNGAISISGNILSDQDIHDYTLKFDVDLKQGAVLNPYLKNLPTIPDNATIQAVLEMKYNENGVTHLKTDAVTIIDSVDQSVLAQTGFSISDDSLNVTGDSLNLDAFFEEDKASSMIRGLFAGQDKTVKNKATRDIKIDVKAVVLNEVLITGLNLDMNIDNNEIDVTQLKSDNIFGSDIDLNGTYTHPSTQNVNAEIALNGTIKTDNMSNFLDQLEALTKQDITKILGDNQISTLLQKSAEAELVIDLTDQKPEGAKIALSGIASGADIQLNMTAKTRDFSDKIDGVLRIKGDDINTLFPLLNIKGTETKTPYDLYGNISGDSNDMKIENVKATLNNRAFTGSVRHLSDRLRFDLSADTLTGNDTVLFSQAQSIITEKELEGDISLKIKTMKDISLFDGFKPLTLNKLHIKGRFDEKEITLDDARFALKNAVGKGDLVFAANGDKEANFSFDDVDLDDFGLTLPIKSQSADIDLEITQKTDDKMIEGKGDFTMRKGTLTGVDLGDVMSGLATLSSSDQSRVVLREAFATGETEFSRAKASFSIDGDVTNFEDIDIAGDFGKISGQSGTYNRNTEAYELPLDFSLVTPVNLPQFRVFMRESGNETDASDLEAFFSKSIKERAKPSSQNFDELLKNIKDPDQPQ